MAKRAPGRLSGFWREGDGKHTLSVCLRETGLPYPLWPHLSVRRPFPATHRAEGGPSLLAHSARGAFSMRVCGHVAGCALRAQRVSTCACVHTSVCRTGIGLLCKMEAPSYPGTMVRLETTIRPSLPPVLEGDAHQAGWGQMTQCVGPREDGQLLPYLSQPIISLSSLSDLIQISLFCSQAVQLLPEFMVFKPRWF